MRADFYTDSVQRVRKKKSNEMTLTAEGAVSKSLTPKDPYVVG